MTKPVGEPDAGNPHVRFDERGWETERRRMAQATAPILDSTEAAVCCGATSGRVLEILWTRRDFRVKQRAQHGQRGIVRTIADFPQITVFQAIGTSR
jgi:hypothetical protein